MIMPYLPSYKAGSNEEGESGQRHWRGKATKSSNVEEIGEKNDVDTAFLY